MLPTSQVIKVLKHPEDVGCFKSLDGRWMEDDLAWALSKVSVDLDGTGEGCGLSADSSILSGLCRHIRHDFIQCPLSNCSHPAVG